MFHRILIGAAALAASIPAGAAWHRASTPHFIIYADEDPKALEAFARKLERFDFAVRQVRGMSDPPVGDGNRLTVFVVPTVSDVQDLQRGITGERRASTCRAAPARLPSFRGRQAQRRTSIPRSFSSTNMPTI